MNRSSSWGKTQIGASRLGKRGFPDYATGMNLTVWILAGVALFSSSGVYAALGGGVASIQQDAQALGAPVPRVPPVPMTRHSNYDRYEISSDWLHLHEFVGRRGNVFALAWNGKRHPDLRTLLGEHFRDFQGAIAQARKEHRRGGTIVVDSGDFHLEIGGHMMSVYGLIWLKDQIPSGMDLHEIR